jgi:hypothetical protein
MCIEGYLQAAEEKYLRIKASNAAGSYIWKYKKVMLKCHGFDNGGAHFQNAGADVLKRGGADYYLGPCSSSLQ